MNGRNNNILTKGSLENTDGNKKLRERKMDYKILGDLYKKYLEDNPEVVEMLKKQNIDIKQYLQFLTYILKNSNTEN